MLSYTSWGAHSSVLLKIHKSLILSKIDYGSPLFSSAIQSHLKKLENIHNSGMRLAIGAFRSSPIDSISNIAGIPSLSLRWAEQKSLLAARIHRSPQGISTSPNNLFTNLQDKLNLDQILPSTTSLQPTWTITLDINLELHQLPKKDTNPKIYKYHFNEIIANAEPHIQIYTDASITNQRVGAAIICGDTEIQLKLSDKCSIYTAEAMAILEAIKYFIQSVDDKRCIILSDSLSAITSLKNINNPTDIARNIHNLCHIAHSAGKHISFMWIPGHCNITGNEKADEVAKLSYTSLKAINVPVNEKILLERSTQIKRQRVESLQSLEKQAKKMKKIFNKKFPAALIGQTVRVKIPDFDRCKIDSCTLLAIVVEIIDEEFYRLGSKAGTLNQLFTRNQFTLCEEKFISISDVPNTTTSIRQAVAQLSLSGGQGFLR
ncbi:uncharacterized protein LOC126553875 [Aphis gossypii]|uniref:uncharacterized protein LOC126553875 n=1 Tax=Aphis gossypii TaxID=80765 RepID=UPI0021590ED7|nr:uncharacterized protein LOC126553875 [Aphis gossypii]